MTKYVNLFYMKLTEKKNKVALPINHDKMSEKMLDLSSPMSGMSDR